MAAIGGRPVGIMGTGMRIPEKVITNADLEKMVDTSNDWIVERTGINTRHIVSDGDSNTGLSAAAAMNAMKDAGIDPDHVDMVIVGTNSPDTLFPGVGPVVQDMIGADNAGGMDVQAGCPGGLYAMVAAAGGIASGIWENVVVIGSEALTRMLDWTDRNTCVLFGDGAAAFVMGPWRESEKGMLRLTHADLRADGGKSDLISLPGGLAAEPATNESVREKRHCVQMRGNEVFKFVNREIPRFLESFCRDSGVLPRDIDWWIFHQANLRILEGIARRMHIPMERMIVNLDRYGNTSSASIMLALHEAREDGRIRSGQRIVISSFGAGMTYGAVLLES